MLEKLLKSALDNSSMATDDTRSIVPNTLLIVLQGNEKFIANCNQHALSGIIMDKNIAIENLKISRKYKSVTKDDEIIAAVKSGELFIISIENLKHKIIDMLNYKYNPKAENICAITGTNGKTSSCSFVGQLLFLCGQSALCIGTTGCYVDGQQLDSEREILTTPSSFYLHHIIAQVKKNQVNYVAMEASSHGIAQARTAGLKINVAAFTNLSQDHLDYHGSMQDYFTAKKQLFSKFLDQSGAAVLNADIPEYEELCRICVNRNLRTISYGKNGNDLQLIRTEENQSGQIAMISNRGEKYKIHTEVIGNFQLMNMLCAAGIMHAWGFEFNQVLPLLDKLQAPMGRMQKIKLKSDIDVYIDYAHTPDALEKALQTLRKIAKNRLIVVFGCGGNRDTSKRPIMGAIAAKYADLTIITDDNERHENPAAIRAEIIGGIQALKQQQMAEMRNRQDKISVLFALQADSRLGNFLEVTDSRRNAIFCAIEEANMGDIVLIAGKGHEKHHIIGDIKHPFDDALVSEEALILRNKNNAK